MCRSYEIDMRVVRTVGVSPDQILVAVLTVSRRAEIDRPADCSRKGMCRACADDGAPRRTIDSTRDR